MADSDNESNAVEDAWNKNPPPFTKEDNPHGLLVESSFTVRFPGYREAYLQKCWPLVEKAMASHGVTAKLDLVQGSMTVVTTRKTWDPFAIIKARDLMNLLSRSMPFEKAVKVLDEGIFADIIKIDGLVSNQERFVKRRQRILGPDDLTLKTLEMLTKCDVQVQGGTVAVVGSHKGLQQIRKVVLDIMKNVHPVYCVKALMIKHELAKDENMKNEDWSLLLPAYESKKTGSRKKPKLKKKKEYTPFPPPQLERKVDKELATGEFFQKEKEKYAKKMADRQAKGAASKIKQQEKRSRPFVAPKEELPSSSKEAPKDDPVNIAALKKKIKESKAKKRRLE